MSLGRRSGVVLILTVASRASAASIPTPVATRGALILFFALDSDPRALTSLSAARPIFGAPVALFGAWLSFRERG
jgi:hypothetical protein